MRIKKSAKFLFFNFILIYFIYIGLAGIAFPKQGVVSMVFPGLALLFLFWLVLRSDLYKFSIWIYSYLLFLFLLVLFSSDIHASLKSFLKVSMTFMMLPVSFQLVRDLKSFKRMNKVIILLMLLYLVNFAVMNFLGISFKGYGDDITTGNIFSEGLNAMAYALVILPAAIFIINKRKGWLILLGIVVFITLIVSLKRISILAVFAGYLIIFFSLKRKRKLVKGGIVMLTLLIASFPLYSDTLIEQIGNRSTRFKMNSIQNEGRYKETLIVFGDVFSFDDIPYSLIGKELFNSPGTYGSARDWNGRQLHSDYNVLLHGSGIIGLIWYFLVQGVIFFTFQRYKKKISKISRYSKKRDHLNAAFYAVFFLGFVISFSGGINGVIFNILRYGFLGAILGLYYSILKMDEPGPYLSKNL